MKVLVVGGCGHIGLPLSALLAFHGNTVVAYDVNKAVVDSLNDDVIPYHENGLENLLANENTRQNLSFTHEKPVVAEFHAIIFAIGTPVDEYSNPSVGRFLDAIRSFSGEMTEDQVLIVRSSIFPGTSKRIMAILSVQDLQHFAYCPERILQGNALDEIASLPQLAAASNAKAMATCKDIFGCLGAEILDCSFEEAELTKLYANFWRYAKFAVANQLYMMAEMNGVDFNRIHELMTYRYDRAADLPKPGFAAGPCLLKDTQQLVAFNNNEFLLGSAAININEGLPYFIARQIEDKMELEGRAIAILGMTFKKDCDDIRDSLSFKLKKILELKGADVIQVDPFLPDTQDANLAIEQADFLVVGVPHSQFGGLDVGGKPFIDLWGVLK